MSQSFAAPIVTDVLSKFGASASFQYWGSCTSKTLDFPRLRSPEKSAGSPVELLQEIFANNPRMRVTQEAGGIIRMAETDVPQDLLNVRISRGSFKGEGGYEGLYTPAEALLAIESTPEVEAFRRAHDIGPFGFRPVNLNPIFNPSPKLPHMSGDLYNVTLAQALDQVLQTFPGMWVYENCTSKENKRIVCFAFYETNARTAR